MWIHTMLFAVAGAAAGCAAAQPVAAPAVLGLPEVLQAARLAPDIAVSRQALAAARADVAAADHVPVPVLTAKASSIDLQNGVGAGNALRDKRIDKSLGVDWTLERGNKRVLRTRAAESSAAAAALDVQEALVQQQVTAASAFYDLLAAQERVAQTAAIESSAAQLATSAQRRLRAGDLSQQDALRIETEAQRVRADLRAAQADRQRAMIVLGQLTGRNLPLEAQAGWPAAQSTSPEFADVEARSDVRAARERLVAAQAALEAALALRRNDVTLGASFDHFPGTSNRLLELRVQMPLGGVLGGYGYEGEIGRARAGVALAESQLEKTRRAAGAEASRQWQDLQAGAARVRDYDDIILPRARQVAVLAETAYSKGAMSLTDLIDARRTLRNVLLEDVAARADHARALSAWQLRTAAAAP